MRWERTSPPQERGAGTRCTNTEALSVAPMSTRRLTPTRPSRLELCPRPARLETAELDRFLAKTEPGAVAVAGLGRCFIWTGATRGPGYGDFKVRDGCGNWVGRNAHIYAYEQVHGPVPAGLVLDHRCRVLRCVRVSHLEAVPNYVNVYRGVSFIADRAAATHCVNGHELTGANLYERRDRCRGDGAPRRECRTCRNETSAARRRAVA